MEMGAKGLAATALVLQYELAYSPGLERWPLDSRQAASMHPAVEMIVWLPHVHQTSEKPRFHCSVRIFFFHS